LKETQSDLSPFTHIATEEQILFLGRLRCKPHPKKKKKRKMSNSAELMSTATYKRLGHRKHFKEM